MRNRLKADDRAVIAKTVNDACRHTEYGELLSLMKDGTLAADDAAKVFLLARTVDKSSETNAWALNNLGISLLYEDKWMPIGLASLHKSVLLGDAFTRDVDLKETGWLIDRILTYRGGSPLASFVSICAMLSSVVLTECGKTRWSSLTDEEKDARVSRLYELCSAAAGIGTVFFKSKEIVNGKPTTIGCAFRVEREVHVRRSAMNGSEPPVKVLFHEFYHEVQYAAENDPAVRALFEITPDRQQDWALGTVGTFASALEEDAETFGQNVYALYTLYYDDSYYEKGRGGRGERASGGELSPKKARQRTLKGRRSLF